jgi:hypothetical protein
VGTGKLIATVDFTPSSKITASTQIHGTKAVAPTIGLDETSFLPSLIGQASVLISESAIVSRSAGLLESSSLAVSLNLESTFRIDASCILDATVSPVQSVQFSLSESFLNSFSVTPTKQNNVSFDFAASSKFNPTPKFDSILIQPTAAVQKTAIFDSNAFNSPSNFASTSNFAPSLIAKSDFFRHSLLLDRSEEHTSELQSPS